MSGNGNLRPADRFIAHLLHHHPRSGNKGGGGEDCLCAERSGQGSKKRLQIFFYSEPFSNFEINFLIRAFPTSTLLFSDGRCLQDD
jgi:hypothetical protein